MALGNQQGPGRVTPVGAGGASTAIVVALIIAALYIGRDIFVPLALAALLSFMLLPLVSWLQRNGIPKIVAVCAVVGVVLVLVGASGVFVAGQVTQLANNLPNYKFNMQIKIRDAKAYINSGRLFGRVSEMIEDLGDEVARPSAPEPGSRSVSDDASSSEEVEPIPVEIADPGLSPREIVETLVVPFIKPVATAGIVIVFVIFILLQKQDIRDRAIRLVSAGDLSRTTEAFEDAGSRVAGYLLMQFVVNLTYGIPIGIGLWFIGVPNAALWGMLAVILRFIPYVGPILAAIFPLALSVAVDSGWTMLLWTATLFIIVELLSNNIVEPYLYGAKTGLSPLAIMIAAIFWTWLWGPVGLLLSTPLTVSLVVLGRHVPQFSFFDVLLGNEPVLTPAQRFYQRVLALDSAEATETAEQYLKDHALELFYNDVVVPALVLLERDRQRRALTFDRLNSVIESIDVVVDNLAYLADVSSDDPEHDENERTTQENDAPSTPRPADMRAARSVVCVGARSALDDAAARILSDLLSRRGIASKAMSWIDVTPANLPQVEFDDTDVLCLVYLDDSVKAHARYLVGRIRRHASVTCIHLAFLSQPSRSSDEFGTEASKADVVSRSLIEALDQITEACWDGKTLELRAS